MVVQCMGNSAAILSSYVLLLHRKIEIETPFIMEACLYFHLLVVQWVWGRLSRHQDCVKLTGRFQEHSFLFVT